MIHGGRGHGKQAHTKFHAPEMMLSPSVSCALPGCCHLGPVFTQLNRMSGNLRCLLPHGLPCRCVPRCLQLPNILLGQLHHKLPWAS